VDYAREGFGVTKRKPYQTSNRCHVPYRGCISFPCVQNWVTSHSIPLHHWTISFYSSHSEHESDSSKRVTTTLYGVFV